MAGPAGRGAHRTRVQGQTAEPVVRSREGLKGATLAPQRKANRLPWPARTSCRAPIRGRPRRTGRWRAARGNPRRGALPMAWQPSASSSISTDVQPWRDDHDRTEGQGVSSGAEGRGCRRCSGGQASARSPGVKAVVRTHLHEPRRSRSGQDRRRFSPAAGVTQPERHALDGVCELLTQGGRTAGSSGNNINSQPRRLSTSTNTPDFPRPTVRPGLP